MAVAQGNQGVAAQGSLPIWSQNERWPGPVTTAGWGWPRGQAEACKGDAGTAEDQYNTEKEGWGIGFGGSFQTGRWSWIGTKGRGIAEKVAGNMRMHVHL